MRFSNTRIVFSISERILLEYWDAGEQKAVSTKKIPDHGDINFNLEVLRKEAKKIFRLFIFDKRKPTPKLPKEELNKRFKKKLKSDTHCFLKFIEYYPEKFIDEYCKEKRINLEFNDITLDFYYGFTDYLLVSCNFSNNTVGKYINKIKRFMNEVAI